MSEQRRVLVVVDPTATVHPAIERAAWLARHALVRLEPFISDYAPQVADPRFHGVSPTLVERHRRWLEALAAPLRSAGPTVDVDARFDHPLYESPAISSS